MSMQYIRDAYKVPAKRGARVAWRPTQMLDSPIIGTITSATSSGHIRVRFDGERVTRKLHPTWALTYLTPNL